MRIEILIMLLVVHYLADFVFQRRADAEEKHKSVLALLSHCSWYLFITYFLIMFIMPIFVAISQIESLYLTDGLEISTYSLCLVVLHFATDYFTSKISHNFYEQKKIKYFWATIGADQLLHQIQIIVLGYLFFG